MKGNLYGKGNRVLHTSELPEKSDICSGVSPRKSNRVLFREEVRVVEHDPTASWHVLASAPVAWT
jgi:hypothetical protein